MASKLVVIMVMVAISGSYSFDVPENCVHDKYNTIFTINCTISNGRMKMIHRDFEVNIICETDTKELAMIDLRTFPKLNIDKAFHDISITDCTISDGYSFGALIEHFGIKGAIQRFEGINIGSSLNGRFSSKFENLEKLVLRNNKNLHLDEDAFGSLSKLTELDISRNEIYELPENMFKNLTELKTLKLNSIKLQDLHPLMFAQQKKLNVLNLNNNRLSNLTKEMFDGLDSLTFLTIERNRFRMVKDDVFDNMPKLQRIHFGHDNINMPYNIFANNYNLKYVQLLQVKIPNGLNLTGLEILRIKSSEIVNISGLSNIKNVSITESDIQTLAVNTFENQSGMINLHLSSKKLTELKDGLFYGLDELTYLNLSNNNLTNISG